MLTRWAISEPLQLICLSTASQSSLHPLGFASCLTTLPNLIDLLVYMKRTLNMSVMVVDVNANVASEAGSPINVAEEMFSPSV